MTNYFKCHITEVSGLRFVADRMALQSSAGRNHLMHMSFMTDAAALQTELDHTEAMLRFRREEPATVQTILLQLEQLHDIKQSLKNLHDKIVLDDVEFFEIKKFTIISQQIEKCLLPFGFVWLAWQDITAVLSLLNPSGQQTPNFYIYPDYDERLPLIHKQLAAEKNEQARQELLLDLAQAEDDVRQKLSDYLQQYIEPLQNNLNLLACIDVLLAKAQLAEDLHLIKPQITTDRIRFTALFNPAVAARLQQNGHQFQPIDISIADIPCLITGANMSGKSVLLKTIGLAQTLFQFGFFVPAAAAELTPVAAVMFSMGDAQSDMNGLSSFAVEILNIQHIIQKVKSGQRILALVDELARTTNPDEGKALVNAFVQLMSKYDAYTLITTHYSGIHAICRRLQVKGLQFAAMPEKITPENLQRYMDYTLEECSDRDVPHEALHIAEIFGVDEEFLALACMS
ncbi:MAG: DNA mismatch repair protein MutS [Bacteroidales bacterium]|jgi:dsDNA-specific endonuclease/ATPase MutS2|nr:DNA mismatch repair protein MutS [Bacteroidales bacterium]